jgi:hypothetical protein
MFSPLFHPAEIECLTVEGQSVDKETKHMKDAFVY